MPKMKQEIYDCYDIFINKLNNPNVISKPLSVNYVFYFNPILRKFIKEYGYDFYIQILRESCIH
jgi:hypothetical protein